MGIQYNSRTIVDGLVLALDAGNVKSYPGIGTSWTDLSGRGNTGTLVNGPTYSSANGGSIVFDGTNDYIDCGNPPSLDITQAITHILWINPISNYASGYNGILVKGRNPDPGGGTQSHTLIYIDPTNNSYSVLYGKSDGSAGNLIANTISTYNQWVCYASTYDGANVTLYKNGVQVNQVAQTGAIYNTNQNAGIKLGTDGRYNLVGGRQYNGNIAQVSIYNRALSAAEVSQNFNALRGRYGI
jgi:hypothetical protein